MKSIRRFLRLRILIGSTLILAAGTFALGLAIRSLDIHEFDSALETKARTLATLVLREEDHIEVDFAGEYMPEFESAENTEYFEFRLPGGAVIERSDMLGERDLPFLVATADEPAFVDLTLPDGRRGRMVQISFPPRVRGEDATLPGDHPFTIPADKDPRSTHVVLAMARSREGLDALLLTIYLSLAVMDILLVSFISLLIHQSLKKGFRPIEELNEQLAGLSPERLDRRLALVDMPDEIKILPSTVNRFIVSLQAAFVRERRFTSDVAHELRTPVAGFRVACEVGGKWSDDPDLVRRRFENLRESALNMERMIGDLLELSRLDSSDVTISKTDVAIASLVDHCWERVCKENVGDLTQLRNMVPAGCLLNADASKLEMILFNLLHNAACYSVPGSEVIVRHGITAAGSWELYIVNQAHDLDEEDLAFLFERFWRKDTARSGGRHFGVGLSIVKALADAMLIQIDLSLSSDKVFTIRLGYDPHASL